MDTVGIAYLSLVRDLSDLSTMVCRISSYLGKESLIFRDKSVFPYQRFILPYQGLSFPCTGLSLRGAKDSEAGKFANNIAFANFPLLGAYV